jgi:hypothetical protein
MLRHAAQLVEKCLLWCFVPAVDFAVVEYAASQLACSARGPSGIAYAVGWVGYGQCKGSVG